MSTSTPPGLVPETLAFHYPCSGTTLTFSFQESCPGSWGSSPPRMEAFQPPGPAISTSQSKEPRSSPLQNIKV